MRLNDKVALITGAAGGIGKGIAEGFLKNGAKGVCLVDIDEKLGQETLESLGSQYGSDKVVFHKCDVSSKEELEASFKGCMDKFGHLDIVCNNAGILNEFNAKLTLAVNLYSVIEGTYLAVKYMGTKNGGKGGVVINTSSTAGIVPFGVCPIYTATKHGIVGFTRSVALEPDVKDNNIRVVAISPTCVDTPMMSSSIKHGTKYPEQFLGMVDPEVFLKMEEVTSAVMQLLEDTTSVGTVNLLCHGDPLKVIPPPTLE